MWQIILTYVITILSLLAAILAWIVRIRWSKEFRKAKEAQIESLKQQIENLKDLTPDKIRKYFVDMKVQLEEYNDLLQKQLDIAKNEINSKQNQINELESDKEVNRNKIEDLLKTKTNLEIEVMNYERKIEEFKKENEKMFFSQQINSMLEAANRFATEQKDIFLHLSKLSNIKVDSDWLLDKYFPTQKKDADK